MDNLISQFILQVSNEFYKIFTPESGASTSEATNRQVASPSKEAYSIAHLLPGRVRLHVPWISQKPSHVERLKVLLEAEQWITSARINLKAASIIITYNYRMVSNSQMRSRLSNLIESAAAEINSVLESIEPASGVNEDVQQAKLSVEVTEEKPNVTDASGNSTQPVPEELASSFFTTQSPPQQTVLTEESLVQEDLILSKLEPCAVPETNPVIDNSRVFLFEVVGLHQSKEADENNWSIRHSGSVFIRVPYNRMNQQMRQINRLGGKIVNIRPA